ncbi:hypothetical protein GCK32_014088 [Trichostrongylus colubriformis]|uniref:Uncharacterized protein n=1 Tax=Trichostrongylus colubriformis TaxID=6319 RepID=A0AAN8EZH1_TRICO
MTVVNELEPPLMATAKSNSSGHVDENNGEEPGLINESSNDGNHREGDNDHNLRQQRLQKAYLVSEEWKSAMPKPGSTSTVKREFDRRRPSLSVDKFKQESASALSTELSIANDSKVCTAIKNMLFLLREADLIKDHILYKCKKMKEDFERDEAVVREMLAEANIPAAISDSLLDSHFIMSSTRMAAPAPEVPPQVLSPNSGESHTDSAVTAAAALPFPPTNVPPPTMNTCAPPPIPVVLPVRASASLPDLTVPPPSITNVANMSTPPPPLPPPLPSSSSSSDIFSVPPPQIPISSGTEPVSGGEPTSYTPSLPPPSTLPPSNVLPVPTSIPPPPTVPVLSASVPTPSTLPPPPMVSEFVDQPPPNRMETTVETILNASLRPCSTLQFSGPFGPPIAPPPRSDYSHLSTPRGFAPPGPRSFAMCLFYATLKALPEAAS